MEAGIVPFHHVLGSLLLIFYLGQNAHPPNTHLYTFNRMMGAIDGQF